MCKVLSLEDYRRKQQSKIVGVFDDFPAADQVTALTPWKLEGNPALKATASEKDYYFPLTNGFQIHYCNEFLRSLNLGLDIHFETYNQYCELLNDCGIVVEERIEAIERG